MRKYWVMVAAVAGVATIGGCRFKGVESFEKSTTPVDYAEQRLEQKAAGAPEANGDPYGNGGIAYASGGTKLKTRYGLGADVNSPQKVDARLDRPAKGTGQQPGEQGGDAAPGHGKSNAPANQPSASIDSATTH